MLMETFSIILLLNISKIFFPLQFRIINMAQEEKACRYLPQENHNYVMLRNQERNQLVLISYLRIYDAL